MNFRDIKILISICSYAYILPILLIIFLLGVMYFCSIIPSIETSDQTIVNYGYLGSFLSGTLGILLTAGSLIFLAKTLNFERNKSDQENFDNKFFLMLERLESIKDKIDENIKNEILKEINKISKLNIEDTLEESKKIIHKNNNQIGHYFRMLYQVLKMVDQNKEKISDFRNVNIRYYTNILRSTLDFQLTQILAINTYYSEKFDSEYEQYEQYVRKYDFFEHMPFCIFKNRISESLLAIYLKSNKGFGNSSFVKKLNQNFIKCIEKSVSYNKKYDLNFILLKRIIGEWESEDIILNISLEKRILTFKEKNNRKWTGELINTQHPESDIIDKCKIFNYGGYDIYNYFDESLNFIIIFDEYSYIQDNSMDYREVEITLKYENMRNLHIEYKDESHIFDENDYGKKRILQKRKSNIPN